MKYGKIRVEDGYLVFTRHMMINSLPCKDIVWAYMRREGVDGSSARQLIVNYLVIITKRKKRYKFDMSEKEVHDCIRLLHLLNPDMAVGFPKGGRILLQSLPNTRDLGAIATEDGRHIIPGKLLRSGRLYHISMNDRKILENEYHLRTVIDLRLDAERKRKPDDIMAGVEYYHIPVLDEDTTGISGADSIREVLEALPDNIEEFMKKQYESIICDQYSIKQYAKFIDIVIHQEEGALLWHCSMGKDRAGIAAALLLSILGVEEEIICEDYLRSSRYLDSELTYMKRLAQTWPDADERIQKKLEALYQVKEAYIDTVFCSIRREYGSMEAFFKNALYLKPKMIEGLKNKYLV